MVKKHFQLNQYIKAPSLRVIDETGTQIGVMSRQEALKKAQAVGLDLIVVAETAQPPVAKIMDFTKFKYQLAKKARAGATKTRGSEVKEVRLTPFMASNDFNVRLERAREFLEDGYRVRLVVKFRGRQITRKEFGVKQMERGIAQLTDVGNLDQEPKWLGNLYHAIIKPNK